MFTREKGKGGREPFLGFQKPKIKSEIGGSEVGESPRGGGDAGKEKEG